MVARKIAVWLLMILPVAPAVAQSPQKDARALFLRGEGAEVRMSEGSFLLPAAGFACANCHGADGMGGREGTTVMPPILWSALSLPGTARPAYDDASFIRALTEGVDPAGRRLDAVMPRYQLPAATAAALPGFLDGLETEQQAGIGPRSLDLVAPDSAAGRAGFNAAITVFNDQGGAFGRALRIVPATAPAVHDFSVADPLAAAIRRAELAALTDAARKAGEPALTAIGLTDDETSRLKDFPIDDGAGALLLAQPSDETSLRAHIYARRDALDDRFIALLQNAENGTRLTVSDPFPDAADWARRNRQGRDGAMGYALGQIAGDAALLAGRQTSQARFAKALEEAAAREVALREMVVAP